FDGLRHRCAGVHGRHRARRVGRHDHGGLQHLTPVWLDRVHQRPVCAGAGGPGGHRSLRESVNPGYPSWPKLLISCASCWVSSRGFSPRASLALCTCSRMPSTTSGLASVVMSPTSVKLDTDAMTRRMIFPDLVFGM